MGFLETKTPTMEETRQCSKVLMIKSKLIWGGAVIVSKFAAIQECTHIRKYILYTY